MEPFWSFIDEHETLLRDVGTGVIKLILLFIVVRIGTGLLIRMTNRILRMQGKLEGNRRETLEMLFANLIRYTFYFIFLLTVLPIFGIHIAGLLAGAGVVGIAIAFAAQSLLKDFFNGFFILFEDQFGVGDQVIINNVSGKVKSVGLRITRLQVWTGQVVTIPNSEIKQVTNYSKENSIAIVDINVGYNIEVEKSIRMIEEIMMELKETEAAIVGDVTVMGVQELNDSTYTIRAIAECSPNTHWGIQRLAKKRLSAVFTEQNIDLPVSQTT
jgi:moderate conductance mechanosensitive channel